ncbi:MAG TPA: hypothetical protein VE053_11355 [Allosphingosinicella sp.]|nr:hypothetical protein [Allosphingosinicella sp.]
MRNFNMLAVLAGAMLMGGGAFAKAQSGQPKPKKICRTEQMSGRITPQRICRVVSPSDVSAQDDPRRADAARKPENGRD